MSVTEDVKISILGRENEPINLVLRIKVDAPVEVSLAEVIQEARDCGAGAQCWYVIA